MLELIPVLRLEPSRYPFAEIAKLPFIENSQLIRITDITDPALIAHLLRFHVGNYPYIEDFGYLYDWQGAFRGGYILKTDLHTIEPNIWSRLGNITSWEGAATYRESRWVSGWMGPPYIYCRFNGSLLEFTRPMESTEAEPQASFTVHPAALQSVVESARETVMSFGERLLPEFSNYVSPNLLERAMNILLWNQYPR